MPGAGDLRKTLGDFFAPVAGGEGVGDHGADAQSPEPDHRREMGMAVAEVLGADDDVAGRDLVCEAGVEAAHGVSREFVRVGEADVLDAHDLVHVEVRLLEDVGDAAAQRREVHVSDSER